MVSWSRSKIIFAFKFTVSVACFAFEACIKSAYVGATSRSRSRSKIWATPLSLYSNITVSIKIEKSGNDLQTEINILIKHYFESKKICPKTFDVAPDKNWVLFLSLKRKKFFFLRFEPRNKKMYDLPRIVSLASFGFEACT